MKSKKPHIIVGTWGLSVFDSAPIDTRNCLLALRQCGASMFDSSLAYGNGEIDQVLGNIQGISVITKIPALNYQEFKKNLYPDFSEYYPEDYIHKCMNRLLTYHNGYIDTLLLHNWHLSWDFHHVRSIFDIYIPKYVKHLGVSTTLSSLRPGHEIPILELPIDPIIHRNDNPSILGRSQILARSIFCHGLLLSDSQDPIRMKSFTPQEREMLGQFHLQHPTIAERICASLRYMDTLPVDIRGLIIGMTDPEHWRSMEKYVGEIYS